MSILRNYFKVAFRNLLRQKAHSLINVLGLSAGLCFSTLIGLYVLFELSFDNFHQKGKQIYLLPMTWHFNGTDLPTGANCSAGGPFMKEAFPQVEEAVRIKSSSLSLRKGTEIIQEPSVYFADSAFFRIFSFSFLLGNPDRSLNEPNSVVLTESMVVKYFGQNWAAKDVLNQVLNGQGHKQYKITGVIRDVPPNSHLQFSSVVSFCSLPVAFAKPTWDGSEYYTYVLLNPHANKSEIVSAIPAQLVQKFGGWVTESVKLDLVPLANIYLHNQKYKIPNISDILYVNIFIGIAVLILVVATFNYINLATARSMERALEVGVRKVMGAGRKQLFSQFMSESVIITSISLLVAVGLAYLLLPLFSLIVGHTANPFTIITDSKVLRLLVGIGLTISFVAGVYPALVLSGFQPARVLKGKMKDAVSGIRLRERLVILQFSISIVLIISALTISSQLKFLRSRDSGYKRDRIVALTLDSMSRNTVSSFKAKALAQPWVASLSAVNQLPVDITFESAVSVKGLDERRLIRVAPVDNDYLETMDIATVSGTGFTKNTEVPGWEVIMNESALGFFGWTSEEAVGKELNIWQTNGIVKGIVKDFHYSSLHSPIAPLLIFTGKGVSLRSLLVRISPEFDKDPSELLKRLWEEANPDSPFLITYLNERYERLYKSEVMMSRVVNLFALLSALISGLGLFGLASYSILQRTKELGIRKVLGASVRQIVLLVSSGFVKQVLVAFLLATPLSYYLMNRWLDDFSYKINFSWLTVLAAGLMTLLIAMTTVTYHSIRVAMNNPVDSLRTE